MPDVACRTQGRLMRWWRLPLLLVLLGSLVVLLWLDRGPLPLRHDVARFLWREGIPGAAVAIRLTDGTEETLEIGRLSDGRSLVRPDTLFPIASLSKPLTAAAIRRLISSGRLRLDDRLSDFLPEIRLDNESPYGAVTIRQLLQHTAGSTGDGPEDPLFSNGSVAGCDSAIQEEIQREEMVVGERSVYSNVGYCMLGAVVAVLAREPYGAAVLDLLQLDQSDSALIFGFPSARAAMADGVHASLPAESYALLGAAGGWFSDARTLARVLADDTATEIQFDRIVLPAPVVQGRTYRYGLGWRVPSDRGNVLTHYGFLPGTFAVAVAMRGRGVAVALFSGSPGDRESAAGKLVSMLSNSLQSRSSVSRTLRPTRLD